SEAISLGPQPVRCRAWQMRSWIFSLDLVGWRCGVEGRSCAHAPETRWASEAWRKRSIQYCTVDTLTRLLAAAWRRESPSPRHQSTSSTRCQLGSHLRLSCIRADDLSRPLDP